MEEGNNIRNVIVFWFQQVEDLTDAFLDFAANFLIPPFFKTINLFSKPSTQMAESLKC